jgi:protein KRI1
LQEKEHLQEEIRQLKNLKRKEIMDKLDQLKEVTGNPEMAFTSKDIEDEFDPDAHDAMMQVSGHLKYYDIYCIFFL